MSKKYSVYGNCQSGALAMTLSKNETFNKQYELQKIKPVQTLKLEDVLDVQNIFKDIDLVIYQHISSNYRIGELSTNRLLKKVKRSTMTISFVSMYFNAYFPHLDKFLGKKSILNVVHDYIIMYCYCLGMTEQETFDVIQREDLYSIEISNQLFANALNELKKREESTDVKVAPFIEKEYQNIKLFNQFNHPKGIVFDYLANQILEKLNIPVKPLDKNHKTGLDGIMSPIYRSTYKNLNLKFEEDFYTYSTVKGHMHQEEVIREFFNLYRTLDKNLMLSTIMSTKPFIIDIFR